MTTVRDGAAPIPVTVIGGYLGSGKTTLVNHLLRTAAGRRIAVLVNEFGSMAIDEDLIEARDDTMINIAGGCVCCSYGSDMMAALMDIQKLNPAPDHVLVEASGVALPGAVAQSVALLSGCRLDGTVVLADAETVRNRAADGYLSDTILRQLAAADIVLLNKVDIVEASDLGDTSRWLAMVAPEARVLATTQASVGADVLLGAETGAPLRGIVSGGAAAAHAPDHAHAHGAGHGDAGTGHHAVAIELAGPVDAEALAERLAARALDLVRAKGIAWAVDGSARTIQVVGQRWRVEAAPPGFTGAGRLVCIRVGGAVNERAVRGAILAVSR